MTGEDLTAGSTAAPAAWLTKIYGNDGVLLDTRLDFVRPVLRSTAKTEFLPLYTLNRQASKARALNWVLGYRDDIVSIRQAPAIGGIYQIRVLKGEVWLDTPATKSVFPSEDAAVAAAQADFEASISAFLSTAHMESEQQ